MLARGYPHDYGNPHMTLHFGVSGNRKPMETHHKQRTGGA